MMVAVALGVAVINGQAQALKQSLEHAVAVQAKIDYDFEQQIRNHYGLPDNATVMVSLHHVTLLTDKCLWNLSAEATSIAVMGLIHNPDSEFLEVTIRDSRGEGRKFLQRCELEVSYPDVIREDWSPPADHVELAPPAKRH
jgi:hypothetical protein